jgi:transcriptional regulator with XRE-family HTH domain
MNTKSLAEIRAKRATTPDVRKRIDEQRDLLSLEIQLHALRQELGISQREVAERMNVSRPRVHTIENAGEDLRLSTLARYIESLGGSLVVSAVFDDKGQRERVRKAFNEHNDAFERMILLAHYRNSKQWAVKDSPTSTRTVKG